MPLSSSSSTGSDYSKYDLDAQQPARQGQQGLIPHELIRVKNAVEGCAGKVFEQLETQILLSRDETPLEFVSNVTVRDPSVSTPLPHTVEELDLLDRVTAKVRATLYDRGYGSILDLLKTDQIDVWITAESRPFVRELKATLERSSGDYHQLLIAEDNRSEHSQKRHERREALLKRLREMNTEEFAAFKFNQDEDHRETYRVVWMERFRRLQRFGVGRDGHLISSRVSALRDGFFKLSSSADPELTRTAMQALIYVLEEADPQSADCAHNLEVLERNLRSRLTPESIEALSTEGQRLLIRAYATTIESILIHYSLGHQNAIGQSTKDEIWERAEGLADFNTLGDPQINFYIWYALQGAQRLKTNEGQLQGILKRLKHVFAAATLIVDIAANREDVAVKLLGAFEALQQAFYHWENHEVYYDSLVMLKKLLRVSESDTELFKKIKKVVQANKGTGVRPEDVEDHLLYGTVDFLAFTAVSTQNVAIKEEALKLILQYSTMNDILIQKKVVDVLRLMAQNSVSRRLRPTAFAALELLEASDTIESAEGRDFLEDALIEVGDALRHHKGHSYTNVLKFLLRRIAEIKDEGYPGISLVNLLAYSQEDNLEALLFTLVKKLGCSIEESDVQGYTPYHAATLQNNRGMVKALAKLQSEVAPEANIINQSDHMGRTPLHLCAISGYPDVMAQLLLAGADVHVTDSAGNTPLGLAIENGQVEMTQMLIEAGGYVSEENSEATPIFYAAHIGQEEVLMALIESEGRLSPMEAVAIQELITTNGEKLGCSQKFARFHFDRLEGSESYCRLFSMFSHTLAFDWEGQHQLEVVPAEVVVPPLIWAVINGDIDQLRVMLTQGEDIKEIREMRDSFGNAPLHYAVEHEGELGEQLTRLLIGAGADPSVENRLGMTPLHIAASRKAWALAEILIQSNAPLDAKEKSGFTPLHLAAHASDKRMVHILLAEGADPNATNCIGLTPLHMAAGETPPISAPSFHRMAAAEESDESDEVALIRALVEKGADLAALDESGNSALHHAARAGMADAVVYFCRENPELFWGANKFGSLPIQDAFRSGDAETAGAMLRHGDDLHQLVHDFDKRMVGVTRLSLLAAETGQAEALLAILGVDHSCLAKSDRVHKGRLPIHLGCLNGHPNVVRVCLQEGSNIHVRDSYEQTPLHLAVTNPACPAVLDDLIDAGADIHAENLGGATVLHEACAHGSCEAVRYLVARGAKIAEQDGDGNTPLHMAARYGHMDVVRFLVEEMGVDFQAANDDGKTPLHSATSQNHVDVAKYLLGQGADANAQDFYGMRPLHYAAQAGSADVARSLLVMGAYLEAQDDEGETALHKASFHLHYDVAKLLLDVDRMRIHPRLVWVGDVRSEQALHEAVKRTYMSGRIDRKTKERMLHLLITRGASLSAQDENGRTVLHRAALQGDLAAVRYIMRLSPRLHWRRQTTLDVVDRFGLTPLHLAASKGYTRLVRWLVSHGANLDAKNNEGETPLFSAVRAGRRSVMRTLLEADASIKKKNDKKETLLHVAIDCLHPDMKLIRTLIEARPEMVLARDKQKNTPLHVAAKRGHCEVARLLLNSLEEESTSTRKKFYDRKNKEGKTAVDVARDSGQQRCAEYLDNLPRSVVGLQPAA